MMNKEKLLQLVSDQNWGFLVSQFCTDDICDAISYRDSMALAYDLFFKNLYNDEIQDFAVRLFFCIKKNYHAEWNADWKNDAFLGNLCSMTWRYDEMYECYKRAHDKLTDPPDSLLLLLAGCNSAPGKPPINKKEAEEYLQKAIAKKITYEAALMMRGLNRDKKDKEQEIYWDQMCQKLETHNIHTETIIPDVLLIQNKK